jgi:hypothetical protein
VSSTKRSLVEDLLMVVGWFMVVQPLLWMAMFCRNFSSCLTLGNKC